MQICQPIAEMCLVVTDFTPDLAKLKLAKRTELDGCLTILYHLRSHRTPVTALVNHLSLR
jgi:hypothetical protein